MRAIGSLISSIFDLKKPLLLEAFLYVDYKNYKILGACNPELAHEALGYEKLIGVLAL